MKIRAQATIPFLQFADPWGTALLTASVDQSTRLLIAFALDCAAEVWKQQWSGRGKWMVSWQAPLCQEVLKSRWRLFGAWSLGRMAGGRFRLAMHRLACGD